jgi:hypothetical protein
MAHDWAVDALADLFRATHRVKTQQVASSRGQRCEDSDVVTLNGAYLPNAAGLVPSVLDLRIAHVRWGGSSNPGLRGQLHYPADIDRPLNEAAADKILEYYNRSFEAISFMPAVASTSGRLHCELVLLLFLQGSSGN